MQLYTCSFRTFTAGLSSMAIGQTTKCISERTGRKAKRSSNSTKYKTSICETFGIKSIAHIWTFWKSAVMTFIASNRMKTNSSNLAFPLHAQFYTKRGMYRSWICLQILISDITTTVAQQKVKTLDTPILWNSKPPIIILLCLTLLLTFSNSIIALYYTVFNSIL